MSDLAWLARLILSCGRVIEESLSANHQPILMVYMIRNKYKEIGWNLLIAHRSFLGDIPLLVLKEKSKIE